MAGQVEQQCFLIRPLFWQPAGPVVVAIHLMGRLPAALHACVPVAFFVLALPSAGRAHSAKPTFLHGVGAKNAPFMSHVGKQHHRLLYLLRLVAASVRSLALRYASAACRIGLAGALLILLP